MKAQQAIPIPVLHLFPVLDSMLQELLASLTHEQWHLPTVARQWDVKDVTAHLLDGNVRNISLLDGYQSNQPAPQMTCYQDLVTYLNQLNATWVNAMKRVSPQQIMQQLAATSAGYYKYISSLDPFAPAIYQFRGRGRIRRSTGFT